MDPNNAWHRRAMNRSMGADAPEASKAPTGQPGPGIPGQGPSEQEKEAQRRAQEEQRRLMLKQILSPEAGERLATVAIVKPDKARQLENYLINAAQTGRLGGQVGEEQLKSMLAQFTEAEKKPKVTVARGRMNFDDDDDDDW